MELLNKSSNGFLTRNQPERLAFYATYSFRLLGYAAHLLCQEAQTIQPLTKPFLVPFQLSCMARCPYEFVSESKGGPPEERYLFRCPKCTRERRNKYRDPNLLHTKCSAIPDRSYQRPTTPLVGVELLKLMRKLMIRPKSGCDCNRIMGKMNALGIEGCLRERSELVADLKKNYDEHYSWVDALLAGAAATLKGIKLSITDPFGSLLDMAIENTRIAIEAAKCQTSASK